MTPPPHHDVTHQLPITESPDDVKNDDDLSGPATPLLTTLLVTTAVATAGNTTTTVVTAGSSYVPGPSTEKRGDSGDKDGGGTSSGVDQPSSSTGTIQRTCQYDRGGYCTLHGEKGTRMFKPSWVTSISKDGKKTRKYKKKWDYVCEPGKKIQPRLSFVKTTPLNKTTLGRNDATMTPVANTSDVSTSKEGQRGSTGVKAGAELVNKNEL